MAREFVMAMAHGFVTFAVPHAEVSLCSRWCRMASWGRDGLSRARCSSSRSVRCVRARPSSERHLLPDPISDPKMMREKLWREFFSDPSQWSDNRSEKVNRKYPDFKHKRTGQSLWLDNSMNPPWVEAELAAMVPGLLQSDIFSWNVKLRRQLKAENYQETLNLFQQMQLEGMMPDKFSFTAVLTACSNLGSLEEGRSVHEQIIKRGCESDIYIATSLVHMYAKCGSIENAWRVFKKMQERNVVSWSAMIGGYAKSEQGQKALELFQKMQQAGVEPNSITFVGVLNACANLRALGEGRRVHEQIIRKGCQSDFYVASCLVDMYAKCGSIEDAWSVFNQMPERDVVSWNAMILGYVKSEEEQKALELFGKMQQEGVEPNTATFVGVLNACSSVAALEEGRLVHEQIVRRGCESDVFVGSCLVGMYAKCGSIEDAWSVFNKMGERDVVSWNAMIAGYVKSEQGLKALELFGKMPREGMEPDAVTFVGALNACASLAALEEGRRVHQQIIERGCESDVYVATCLIDMYAKCGSIKDARSVFDKMRERNVVSWSAMIGGYGMHGLSKKGIELFERMVQEGAEINHITITCLLSACSHGGLVKEGLNYFNTMTSRHSVLPTQEHYACMVDLLGRAGWLEEAEDMTKRMPMEGDICVWRSLLGACRSHGNIEMAERTARRCWELDPENASAHVLLSNTYAAGGKSDRSAAIGMERLERNVCKELGRTWMEVNNVLHSFVGGDKGHPQLLQMHAELKKLLMQMNEAEYIPDTRFQLYEEKDFYLCCRSEKLAIAYGLISTPPGTTLRIFTKDLWICPQCHDATKFIANMVGRIIIVKDGNCFHCFEGGTCSCKAPW